MTRLGSEVATAALLLGTSAIPAVAVHAQGSAMTSAPAISPSLTPDPAIVGRWETVIPKPGGAAIERVLGMQTVHAVLLPSGKVLWASGSSWRNHGPVPHYPATPNPPAGTGVFDRASNPFLNSKLRDYYELVNNVAVYDPEQNTFYRIPHPVPVQDPKDPGHFAPSDLFCTGHLHLPDGNILFTGGTQYYYPYRTGNNSTFIFDWKKEAQIAWQDVDWRQIPTNGNYPWIFAGFMPRGRWYPSIVPLLDGRMAVFGGFVGFDKGHPSMYQFEINHLVDIFDPQKFNPRRPDTAWKSVDVTKRANSPFSTLINPSFVPDSSATSCTARCINDNKYDAFKLYPENYLMPDGRIFLTREGDWVSLRTPSTAFMRRTTKTYWATIGGPRNAPSISFTPGPDRPDTISSYGTTYRDPNSGNITLLGGQPTSPGTLLPMNMTASTSSEPTHFAGGRGSTKKEEFHVDPASPGGGYWTMDSTFLGDKPQDDRTMHYAITLPTRQVLVINGGNYDFYGPVFAPLLYTPKFTSSSFAGYQKTTLSEGVEPRLYHNSALLLPDGRILISGGNSARATVRNSTTPLSAPPRAGQPLPNLGLVDIDMYFFRDGPMARGEKGMLTVPTEDWVAEIFSPPYLFIDPARRAAIRSVAPVAAPRGYEAQKEIAGRKYTLLKSNTNYTIRLDGLPTPSSCGASAKSSLVLIKLSSATHGWENGQEFIDLPFTSAPGNPGQVSLRTPNAKTANIPPAYYMMFYVDCRGKPSVARMVRFDDQAMSP